MGNTLRVNRLALVVDEESRNENSPQAIFAKRVGKIQSVKVRQIDLKDLPKLRNTETAVVIVNTKAESRYSALLSRPGIDEGFKFTSDESFVLRSCRLGNTQIVIAAAPSYRGTLYAVGSLLRHIQRKDSDGFIKTIDELECPAMTTRGIFLPLYFSGYPVTNDATIWCCNGEFDKYREFLEELVLWGMNTVLLWYPMCYSGAPWEGKAGKRQWELWLKTYHTAKSFDLDIHMKLYTNTVPLSYTKTHPNLRATEFFGLWGYPALCPSKPQGRDLLIDIRRKLFEYFPEYDLLHCYPTDIGGCGCNDCHPWYRTYLDMAKEYFKVARESTPRIASMINFWYFTPEEIEKMIPIILESEEITHVGVQFPVNKNCGHHIKVGPWKMYWPLPARELIAQLIRRKKVIVFNDATEKGGWGEIGTYPMPQQFKKFIAAFEGAAGTISYTEGRYDHINKLLMLNLAWNPNRDIKEVVKEVVEGQFGTDGSDELTQAILYMEGYQIKEAGNLMNRARRKMPAWCRKDWRLLPLEVFCKHAEHGYRIFKTCKRARSMLLEATKEPTLEKIKHKVNDIIVYLEKEVKIAARAAKSLQKDLPHLYKATALLKEPHNVLGPKMLSTSEVEKILEVECLRNIIAQLRGYNPNRVVMEITLKDLLVEKLQELACGLDDFLLLQEDVTVDNVMDKLFMGNKEYGLA
jgi:hypothetical protein